MKNHGDLGGCYPPRLTASTDNTLLDVHNSSYDTQPHSLIVKSPFQCGARKHHGGYKFLEKSNYYFVMVGGVKIVQFMHWWFG